MFRRAVQKASTRLFKSHCYIPVWSDLVALRGVASTTNHVNLPLRSLTAAQRFPRHLNDFTRSTNLTTIQVIHQRHFWGVTVAFNQVDPERVRLAGSDRAAAEWVLRNGGAIKWMDAPNTLDDYNLLPSTNFDKYKVENIDLSATDVIGLGFQHLENLQHVKSVKLHGCRTIMNDALEHLHYVKDTLEWLEISRCPMITERGLEHLHTLKKLKTLVVFDLIELKNFDESMSRLRQSMPWCQIICDDPLTTNPEENDTHK